MDQTNPQTLTPPPGAPPPGPEVQPAQDVTPNTGIAKGQSPLAPQSPFAQSTVPQPYQDESAAYARKAEADKMAWEKRNAQWQPIEDRLRKELLAGNPAPPDQQRLPAPPSVDPQRYQQNALAFVGVMAVLGALSSKFTRNAGNASLNAFAGAVQGWQKGNLDAYEQKSKEWEQTTTQMLANNKMILEKYKAVLENKSLNIEQQMMAAKLIAAEYQDKIAFDALDAGNYTMFAQLYDKQTGAQDKAVESFLKLSGDKFHETEQNQAKAKQLETPEGQAWMQGLDPASQMKLQGFLKVYGSGAPPLTGGGSNVANAVDEVGQYKANPQTVLSRMPPQDRQQFWSLLTEKYPDWSQQTYNAQNTGATAGARTEATRAANLDIIINSTMAAIPQAIAASNAVPRGSWVPVNKAIQSYEAGTSDPKLAAFAVANLQIAELWARAMNPTGVMREGDRELALNKLSTATSAETYKVVLDQVMQAMRREKGAVLTTEKERGASRNPDDGSLNPPSNDDGWGEVKVH
jgi:hypothetical protein